VLRDAGFDFSDPFLEPALRRILDAGRPAASATRA
jgi:hypothetical protein